MSSTLPRAFVLSVLPQAAERHASLLRHFLSQGLFFLLQAENVARIILSGRLRMAGQPRPSYDHSQQVKPALLLQSHGRAP